MHAPAATARVVEVVAQGGGGHALDRDQQAALAQLRLRLDGGGDGLRLVRHLFDHAAAQEHEPPSDEADREHHPRDEAGRDQPANGVEGERAEPHGQGLSVRAASYSEGSFRFRNSRAVGPNGARSSFAQGAHAHARPERGHLALPGGERRLHGRGTGGRVGGAQGLGPRGQDGNGRVPSRKRLAQARQQGHGHEGHVHSEQEDGARGGAGERGGQPRRAVRRPRPSSTSTGSAAVLVARLGAGTGCAPRRTPRAGARARGRAASPPSQGSSALSRPIRRLRPPATTKPTVTRTPETARSDRRLNDHVIVELGGGARRPRSRPIERAGVGLALAARRPRASTTACMPARSSNVNSAAALDALGEDGAHLAQEHRDRRRRALHAAPWRGRPWTSRPPWPGPRNTSSGTGSASASRRAAPPCTPARRGGAGAGPRRRPAGAAPSR